MSSWKCELERIPIHCWMGIMKSKEFWINANSETAVFFPSASPHSIQYTWSACFDTIEITEHSKTMQTLFILRLNDRQFPQLEKGSSWTIPKSFSHRRNQIYLRSDSFIYHTYQTGYRASHLNETEKDIWSKRNTNPFSLKAKRKTKNIHKFLFLSISACDSSSPQLRFFKFVRKTALNVNTRPETAT